MCTPVFRTFSPGVISHCTFHINASSPFQIISLEPKYITPALFVAVRLHRGGWLIRGYCTFNLNNLTWTSDIIQWLSAKLSFPLWHNFSLIQKFLILYFTTGVPKKKVLKELLEPWCSGSITCGWHPWPIKYFGWFILRLSKISHSQVKSMVKFGRTALSFGYDFVLLGNCFGTPCNLLCYFEVPLSKWHRILEV